MTKESLLIKQTCAWLPILLSICIMAMLLVTLSTVGLVRRPDEGIEAHIFQFWLVVEFVMIGFFAFKWLPQSPKQALLILILQIIAAFAASFPVFYYNL